MPLEKPMFISQPKFALLLWMHVWQVCNFKIQWAYFFSRPSDMMFCKYLQLSLKWLVKICMYKEINVCFSCWLHYWTECQINMISNLIDEHKWHKNVTIRKFVWSSKACLSSKFHGFWRHVCKKMSSMEYSCRLSSCVCKSNTLGEMCVWSYRFSSIMANIWNLELPFCAK